MSVSREDFEVKITAVGENLYFSHFHLKIHEKMTEERNARLEEYPPFFEWSRMAHYETGVLRLTRAYDKNSLGLLKILSIIESNYKDWNCSEVLDNQILEQDKTFVMEDKNRLVKGLKQMRDKVISHTDSHLFPAELSFDLEQMYGGKLILRQERMSTEEIEKLPPKEKERILDEISTKVFRAALDEHSNILGVKIPSFCELYGLTSKGIEICNKYMMKLGMPPIELKLEGIDE
ncbi:MAG: hypothetical protein WBV73_18170 [Phormidium sp.]